MVQLAWLKQENDELYKNPAQTNFKKRTKRSIAWTSTSGAHGKSNSSLKNEDMCTYADQTRQRGGPKETEIAIAAWDSLDC